MTIKTLRKNILLPPFLDSILLFSTRFLSSHPAITVGNIWSLHKGHYWCRGWWVSAQQFLSTGLSSLWFSRVCLPRASGHICAIMEHFLRWSWCSLCCFSHLSSSYSACAAFMCFAKCPFSEAWQTRWWSAVGLPWSWLEKPVPSRPSSTQTTPEAP